MEMLCFDLEVIPSLKLTAFSHLKMDGWKTRNPPFAPVDSEIYGAPLHPATYGKMKQKKNYQRKEI